MRQRMNRSSLAPQSDRATAQRKRWAKPNLLHKVQYFQGTGKLSLKLSLSTFGFSYVLRTLLCQVINLLQAAPH
jgi:hypothetical protein